MDDFTASVSGSGNITLLTGTANHLTLPISGSGDIKGFGLIAESAKVAISGSGKTALYGTRQLDMAISGSGDAYLKRSGQNKQPHFGQPQTDQAIKA